MAVETNKREKEEGLERRLADVHITSDSEDSEEFTPVGFDYDEFNKKAEGIMQIEKPKAEKPVESTEVLGYGMLLGRIEEYLRPSDGEAEGKVKIPISIRKEGTTKTSLNITEICERLSRDIAHLKQYLEVELSVTSSVDGEGRLVIKGVFPEAQVQKMIRNYIKQYVTCGVCSSLNTAMEKEGKLLFKRCVTCGATQSVNAITQGFKALTTKRSVLRRKTGE